MGEGHTDRFAVADIGSNTVKLTVYACGPAGGPQHLASDADTVRIGYQVSETGRIDPERLRRLISTLQRYERDARALGATRFEAVATQAFRIASDSADAVRAIESASAWRVRIIDAAEETALTVSGAAPWLVPGETNIVADIGGASTEVIALDAAGVTLAAGSVPIGSGLLFDEEIDASPPAAGALERVRERALAALDDAGVVPGEARNLLLPGGTGQYLTMLLRALGAGQGLTPDGLPALHAWLASRHAIETMERIPVQLDRAQVLPASLAIVEALVLRIRPQRIHAIPSGIRDGVARSLCPHG